MHTVRIETYVRKSLFGSEWEVLLRHVYLLKKIIVVC